MESREHRTPDEARLEAVLARDPAADGRFVYAVVTTGIYCRPTCPSRRPKPENVRFFETAEAAEQAGFRACRRCRPTEVSAAQRLVSEVQRLLETAEEEPTLAVLAAATGVSPFHLQRVFKRATGLSPKQYSLALRQRRLEGELRSGKPVTTALYDAGYNSSHGLYARASERLGMKPSALRRGGAGERVHYTHFSTRFGPFFLAATERGVVAAGFGDPAAQLRALAHRLPQAERVQSAAALADHRRAVLTYLEQGGAALELAVDVGGTDFQREVWAALRRIPAGETRSYQQVAEMIGRPSAARAVARACAANPVALAVPCHRVILSSGGSGGYRWGVERKERLLAAERRRG